MDFSLSQEHELIAKSTSDFAREEILPKIKDLDVSQSHDVEIIKKMGKQGLLGICIPKKYGGQSADYISLGLVSLELEKVDSTARVVISVHTGLNSLALYQWGSEFQREKYLTSQAKGDKIAGFALTEPNAGSDVLSMKCTAEKKGNSYILNGEKTWISLANVADHFLVFAYTDKEKKHKGISAFIVERNFPGLTTKKITGKLGVRAGDTGSIFFDDVKIPEENLLGQEGEGFKIAMSAIDNGRYTVASGAVGIIEACLDISKRYCLERETFGKQIGKHQLVQQMIAKMASSRDIGRLLFYRAGWLKNIGKRNTRETSLAKWINTTNAFESANDTIEILGAYGYSNEFPAERMFRNSRGAMIYEGTREIHMLLQAEYELGYRVDKELKKMLPPV